MEVLLTFTLESFACCAPSIQYIICSMVGQSIASISAKDLPTVLYIIHTKCSYMQCAELMFMGVQYHYIHTYIHTECCLSQYVVV